jgi:hypothetical protein
MRRANGWQAPFTRTLDELQVSAAGGGGDGACASPLPPPPHAPSASKTMNAFTHLMRAGTIALSLHIAKDTLKGDLPFDCAAVDGFP